jgi:predicted nucleotidyltransferase
LRVQEGYPLRKVAAFLDIDQAILSKMETGKRKFSKAQIVKLADFFHFDEKELLVAFLSDRIISEVGDEKFAGEALQAAEAKIAYRKFLKMDRNEIVEIISNHLKQFSKVSSTWIYGSFSREDDGPGSDIDLAVKTDEGFSYFDLAEIQHQLENAIHRKFDVGFIDAFKPRIFKNVKPDLKLIYER